MSAFMCSPELISKVAAVLTERKGPEWFPIKFKALWQINRDSIGTRYGEDAAKEIGEPPEVRYEFVIVPYLTPTSPAWEVEKVAKLLRNLECYAYQCVESQELESRLQAEGVYEAIEELRRNLLGTIPAYVNAKWGD